jgi:hypothetical protein
MRDNAHCFIVRPMPAKAEPATDNSEAEWLIHEMVGEWKYRRLRTPNQDRLRGHDSAGNRPLELIRRSCSAISLMRVEEG